MQMHSTGQAKTRKNETPKIYWTQIYRISRIKEDCLTFPQRGSSRSMNLEQWKKAFEEIMNEFIISSKTFFLYVKQSLTIINYAYLYRRPFYCNRSAYIWVICEISVRWIFSVFFGFEISWFRECSEFLCLAERWQLMAESSSRSQRSMEGIRGDGRAPPPSVLGYLIWMLLIWLWFLDKLVKPVLLVRLVSLVQLVLSVRLVIYVSFKWFHQLFW